MATPTPLLKEVMTQLKGGGKENDTIPGRKSFSTLGFGKYLHAVVNDPTHKFTKVGPDGKPVQVSVHDGIVEDLQRTVKNAGYPQESESAILNTTEIATKNLASFFPQVVLDYIRSGRNFELPAMENCGPGRVHLAEVKGKTRTVPVRKMDTGEVVGTSTITTKDHITVRVKCPVPATHVNKVRKDVHGKVVQ